MQTNSVNRFSNANSAKLIIDGKWTECAISELSEGRAAFAGPVAADQGTTVIACIAEVGALPGHVMESGNGTVMVEFGAMAAATAARLSQCAARMY